jgi:hypothetical protein
MIRIRRGSCSCPRRRDAGMTLPRTTPSEVERVVERMARPLRDCRDAVSLNGLLVPWGFVDDSSFLTNAGHVGVVHLRGIDDEGLTHAQHRRLGHRGAATLRRLDDTLSSAMRSLTPSFASTRFGIQMTYVHIDQGLRGASS